MKAQIERWEAAGPAPRAPHWDVHCTFFLGRREWPLVLPGSLVRDPCRTLFLLGGSADQRTSPVSVTLVPHMPVQLNFVLLGQVRVC